MHSDDNYRDAKSKFLASLIPNDNPIKKTWLKGCSYKQGLNLLRHNGHIITYTPTIIWRHQETNIVAHIYYYKAPKNALSYSGYTADIPEYNMYHIFDGEALSLCKLVIKLEILIAKHPNIGDY